MLQYSGYTEFLEELKQRIRTVQIRAALAVNHEMLLLYWQIGKDILAKQAELGWGAKVVEQLAKDLRREFPDIKGFSRTNLLYMRSFAAAYPNEPFVQQLAGQIPWFHNCKIMDKIKDPAQREWYIRKTMEHGWSRDVLVHQIESRLHERLGTAPTNFALTLPKLQSDLARQVLKDPYVFDFLSIGEEAHEKDLEKALVEHIREFLLELGVGFAFVGSQVHLEVGGDDFYIDLLFYHLKLRCYVVIDLKTKKFTPADAGQLNFYLSAVDALMRHPDDQPSIGLIICKDKNQAVAEYALRDINKPMGISGYDITKALPANLKGNLPTTEELEAELEERQPG